MAPTTSTRILDHIVHLTPPGTLHETAERWRELGFTVLPGGRHLDGLTENNLVVLSDGVYLELISFVHPVSHYPPSSPSRREREGHWWANSSPGWIDFGLLGSGSIDDADAPTRISDIINIRAEEEGSGVVYDKEYPKGRKRPDGKDCKWIITDPAKVHGRGTLPFFCGDVTPRKLRVPSEPRSNTEHPSGALGISYLRVLAEPSTLPTISRQLTSVFGRPPTASNGKETVWLLDTGNKRTTAKLILSATSKEEEINQSPVGISEVGFRVEKGRRAGRVRTPQGVIVWVPET